MVQYALSDIVLVELWNAYDDDSRRLCELFNVPPKFPPPATKGSFVSSLFAEFLSERLNLPQDFAAIFDLALPVIFFLLASEQKKDTLLYKVPKERGAFGGEAAVGLWV